MTRSMLPAAVISTSLLFAGVLGASQDPLAVSPDAYRLEFENAWVKVVRVTYGPNVTIQPHRHTDLASAYIYLNDGGPILFKHENLPYGGVTRPVTKAGSFRIYKGLAEVHAVENPTATPSHFLRVEFKTEPLEEPTLKGKFLREAPVPEVTTVRTQFENAQVRIARVRVVGIDPLRVSASAQPALLVALAPTGAASTEGGRRQLGVGKTLWIDGGHAWDVQALDQWTELLRFDFKSGPLQGRMN